MLQNLPQKVDTVVTKLVKKLPAFKEPKGPLLCSEKSTLRPSLEHEGVPL
jgi:hypothetical protein